LPQKKIIVWKRFGEFGEDVQCGAKDSKMGPNYTENDADVVRKLLGSEKSLASLLFNLLAGAYGRTSLVMVCGAMGLDGFLSSGADGDNLNLQCNEEKIALNQSMIYGWMKKYTS
jgi:hypothetical protein